MLAGPRFLAAFVVAFFVSSAGTAGAYHTRFVKRDSRVETGASSPAQSLALY